MGAQASCLHCIFQNLRREVMNGREQPNFLILFTDQQRYDTIDAAGYSHMKTPNLDRLAIQRYGDIRCLHGVRLEDKKR